MAHRDISPKTHQRVPPYQIEHPGGRPPTQMGPGFTQPPPQPQPVPPRPPRVQGGPQISTQPRTEMPDAKEAPESLEFARPIPISTLGLLDNPELDKEFEIGNLGIDLLETEPLLPYVYNVASDAPMVLFGQFPAPASYASAGEQHGAEKRMQMFSDEALIFMFYVHARDTLQVAAAAELKRRRFMYDKESKRWYKAECLFDVDNWCFLKPGEIGRNPVRQ